MKSHLLIISLSLIACFTKGQDYIPLLEGNPVWKVYGIDNSQISEDSNTNVEYRLEGDTVINGLDYRILSVDRSESSYLYPFITEAYLRENLDTRQVFIRFREEDQLEFGNNEELLLYDFSLSEGESFFLYEDFEGNEVNIISETTYTIDGVERTAWLTDFPLTGTEVESTYVEGFGFLSDLLMPVLYSQFSFYSAFTYCYNNSTEDITQEFEYPSVPVEFDCNGVLSASDHDNDSQMLVYPNPSFEKVFIQVQELEELIVSDLVGQVIFEASSHGSDRVEINTSDWVEGLYLVKACQETGECGVKRLVVKN